VGPGPVANEGLGVEDGRNTEQKLREKPETCWLLMILEDDLGQMREVRRRKGVMKQRPKIGGF
jgi:hypothetical protein